MWLFFFPALGSDHFLTEKGFDWFEPSVSPSGTQLPYMLNKYVCIANNSMWTTVCLARKTPWDPLLKLQGTTLHGYGRNSPKLYLPPSDLCFGVVRVCVLMLLSCFPQTVQLLYFVLSKRHDSGNSLSFSSSEQMRENPRCVRLVPLWLNLLSPPKKSQPPKNHHHPENS